MILLMLAAVQSASANLVCWWNLADASGTAAADSSRHPVGGSANDGTLNGFPVSPPWNQGLTGASDGITMPHGLLFAGYDDGGDDKVNLSAHIEKLSALSNGTVSVWFRRDADARVDNCAVGTVGATYMRLQVEDGNSVRVRSDNIEVARGYVNDGNWHHLAFTSTNGVSQHYFLRPAAHGARK